LVSHIQGYSLLMKIASTKYWKIAYDDEVLIMLEFCVLAGVLYGAILPIVERWKRCGEVVNWHSFLV